MSKNELSPIAELGRYLDGKKPILAKIAPKGADIDKIVALATFEAVKNEQLLQCSPQSMYMALSKACQLNLVAGGVLHRSHLVPLWNKKTRSMEAELWVDYTGLMELVRRSGEIAGFVARVVHEGEEFEHYFDLNEGEILRHRPNYEGKVGEPMLAYAVCYFKDGQKQVEVMRKDQIEKIRTSARSGNSGPWVTHTEEMWRKTVIRRICKYLPLTPEAKTVMEHDTTADIKGGNTDFFLPETVKEDIQTERIAEQAQSHDPIDVDSLPPKPKRKSRSKAAKVVETAQTATTSDVATTNAAEEDFVINPDR
jgi:recombination protein RecT